MAGKKKTGKDDIDDLDGLPDFDDGDFDLDIDFDDDPTSRKPGIAGVAKDAAKEAGKGFFSDLAKKSVKKALPEEYEYNYDEAMDYLDAGKEALVGGKHKIEKSLFNLGKEVKKILPFQSKLLNDFLEKKQAEADSGRTASEEEQRQTATTAAINDIFDKQMEMTKAIEAKHEAKGIVADKEKAATTKMQMGVFTSIERAVNQQAAFTTQIGKEYYRKSLELQFKSYYVQLDLLKATRENFKAFSIQFDSIIKNTGLPDFVKMQNKEVMLMAIKQSQMKRITDKMFDKNTFVSGVKSKFGRLVNEKVGDITDKIDAMAMPLGMLGDNENPFGSLITVLAGLGGSMFGEKAGEKTGDWLKGKLQDNKTIKSGGHLLTQLSNDPVAFFKTMRSMTARKAKQYEAEENPIEFVLSKLFGGLNSALSITEVNSEVHKVSNKSNILDAKNPAIFDQQTHRSITEVIPLYLKNMLQRSIQMNEMFHMVFRGIVGNDMPKEHSNLEYDYNERKLNTKEGIVKGIEDRLEATLGNRNNALKGNTNRFIENIKRGVELRERKLAESNPNDKKANSNKAKDFNKAISDKEAVAGVQSYVKFLGDLGVDNIDYEQAIVNSHKLAENYRDKNGQALSPEKKAMLIAHLNTNTALEKFKKAINKLESDSDFGDATKGAKEDYARSLGDVFSDLPIGAIQKCYKDMQLAIKAKDILALSKVHASLVGSVLFYHISKYTTFSAEDTLDSNNKSNIALSVITVINEENMNPKEVEKAMKIFLNPIKLSIKMDGKGASEGNLGEYVSAVNASLSLLVAEFQKLPKLSPQVFQDIQDAYPSLITTGLVTNEAIFRGKLTGVRYKESATSMNNADLKNMKKRLNIGKLEHQDLARASIDQFIGGSTVGRVQNIYNNVRGQKNVFDMVRTFKSEMSRAKTDIMSEARKFGSKLDGYMNEANKLVNSFNVTQIKNLSKVLAKNIPSINDEMDLQIANVSKEIEEVIKANEALKQAIISQIRDGDISENNDIKRINKMIEDLKKYRDSEIKVYQGTKDKLSKFQAKLNELAKEGSTTMDVVIKFRNSMADVINDINRVVSPDKYVEIPQTPIPVGASQQSVTVT